MWAVKIIHVDTRPRVYYYSSNRGVIYMSARVVKTLTVTSVINHKENVQELEYNWNWQELRHKVIHLSRTQCLLVSSLLEGQKTIILSTHWYTSGDKFQGTVFSGRQPTSITDLDIQQPTTVLTEKKFNLGTSPNTHISSMSLIATNTASRN